MAPTKPAQPDHSIVPNIGDEPRLDATLARLQRCLSTRAGFETINLFLLYASRLSGNAFEAVGHVSGGNVARLAVQLQGRSKAVTSMLGDVRAFGRLWGLLGLYSAAKRVVVLRKLAEADGIMAAAQVLLQISFHATDNLVYLSSRNIVRLSLSTRQRLSRWCMRSWALNLIIDLGRLLLERWRGRGEAWERRFLRSLAWSPIALHRSVENGPLSDVAITLLGLYPATSKMKELWESEAR